MTSHPTINWLEDRPELKGHVKDQENRCNCWAIACSWATGARHAIHRRLRMKLVRRWLLSAQYLVDNYIRDHPEKVPDGSNGRPARDQFYNYPLNSEYALDYIKSNGIPYEDHYPYTGCRDRSEERKDTTEELPKVYISDFLELGSTAQGNESKEAIYEALRRGPLIGTIDQSYAFGAYMGDWILRPSDIESVSEYSLPKTDDDTTEVSTEFDATESDANSGDSDEDGTNNDDELNEDGGDESNEDGGDESNEDGGDESNEDGGDESNEDGDDESNENEDGGDELNEDGGDESNEDVGDESNEDGTNKANSNRNGDDSDNSNSHNDDDAGIMTHVIVIVGMDYDNNYFLVQNSAGLTWGLDGVGKIDCDLIYDILEPNINDERNRGFQGPASSYSPKQQRELKRLGKVSGQCLPREDISVPAPVNGLETSDSKIASLPDAWSQKPGSAAFPFFGIQAAIVDDKGSGYLCNNGSWLGESRALYGDYERYKSAYFKPFPGSRDKDGYYWLTARVDDTINVSGDLFGTAEVKCALVSHSQCTEAAVGVEHEVKPLGESLVRFKCVSKS